MDSLFINNNLKIATITVVCILIIIGLVSIIHYRSYKKYENGYHSNLQFDNKFEYTSFGLTISCLIMLIVIAIITLLFNT